MQAVQSLCKKALYLKAGQVVDFGASAGVINNYLGREVNNRLNVRWAENEAPGNDFVKVTAASVALTSGQKTDAFMLSDALTLSFEFVLYQSFDINLSVHVNTASGLCVFNSATESKTLQPGLHKSELKIPGNFLNDDIYTIKLAIVKDSSKGLFRIEDLLTFEIAETEREGNWFGKWEGAVRPKFEFTLI